MKLDSHQHFWNYDSAEDSWINEKMSVLKKDYLPSDLEPLLFKNDFDGCIAVQSRQHKDHNNFLLGLAATHSCIKGIVGWVDLSAPEAQLKYKLELYSESAKLRGFRHVLQAEPVGFMAQQAFIQGVKSLSNYNFTYDLLITSDQLSEAESFVRAVGDTKIVIDHLAKPKISTQAITQWRKSMLTLSQFPNVYCKVSGMVTEADWHHWKDDDFRSYLDFVVEAFTPDRLMYGSDWPVCLLAATYEQQLNICKNYFAEFSHDEKENIFGLTATKFYSIV